MNYFTSKQASEKWFITPNRVTILCKNGQIPGAIQIGGQWMIPSGTAKPIDGRTKDAKMKSKSFFRFPLYVNTDENSFIPQLNDEELLLRKSELDFYSCNFESAENGFENLLQNTKDIYVKIMALFYLCSLAVEVYGGKNFMQYFAGLQAELSKDFPYKKEMELVVPWINTIMVQFKEAASEIKFNPLYDYSPTVYSLISLLSFYHLSNVVPCESVGIHFDVYETLCREYLENGKFYEACELHFLLFIANYALSNEDVMLYHLRKGMTIANEHKFYIIASSYEYYYQNAFNIVFKEFPEDFVRKIKHYSEIIRKSLGEFSQKYNDNAIYSTLSKSDYRYLIYAFQRKTNKEVALEMHLSPRTVANHYSELYTKLGIGSKLELSNMLAKSFNAR